MSPQKKMMAEGGLGGDRKAPQLIVIEGTNASGKSSLAVELAKQYGGEIISADSRQVYRRMDLGSGKITEQEMRGVPHHLLDVRDPGEFFSMADFQRLAYEAIDDILSRGKIPFLVGGTGLYVDAVADGYVLSEKAPDHALRAHLETFDTPALYEMLRQRLPETDIDPRNRHRVMRALERLEAEDYHPAEKSPRYDLLKLGVTWPRPILKQRIDERLDRRLEAKISYDQMKEELARAIKKFAKRQMTWFRRDPRIHWLDMQSDPLQEATSLIKDFLTNAK